ncbi:MAG: RHS repeat-associated core domain-containing protein [Bacteroidales bacterium]
MNILSRKFAGFLLIFLCLSSIHAFAQWEIISSRSRIVNLETIDYTWYAIEYGSDTFIYSDTHGTSWETVPGFSYAKSFKVQDNKVLLSGTYNGQTGLFLSTDYAQTWTKLNFSMSTLPQDMLLTDDAIYLLYDPSPSVISPVYRSQDEGNTFNPLPVLIEEGFEYASSCTHCQMLTEHEDRVWAYVGGAGVYVTQGANDSLVKRNSGLPIGDSLEPEYAASFDSNDDGLFISYNDTILYYYNSLFKYNVNTSEWEKQEHDTYYYDTDVYMQPDGWYPQIDQEYISLLIADTRMPYKFAVNDEPGTYIYYSLNDGDTWYCFSGAPSNAPSDLGMTDVSSVKIAGNYVYAGFTDGFARRSLSEAINHTVQPPDEIADLPVSPENMDLIANLLASGSFSSLDELLNSDSFDLLQDELNNTLSGQTTGLNDLLLNSQPGSCSFMGMPSWFVSPLNMKPFFRDVIFTKKGLGPEINLAFNFNRTSDTMPRMFGKHRRFEYEYELVQLDSAVLLNTGTSAHFVFTAGNSVDTSAAPFLLPCMNNENLRLYWTGDTWQLEKGEGYLLLDFEPAENGNFRLHSIEDAYGKKLLVSYNAHDLPVLIIDAAGREYSFTYNDALLCDSLSTPDGRTAQFAYNDNKQLVSSVDFAGLMTSYAYDSVGNIASINTEGKQTDFVYHYDMDSTSTDTTGFLTLVTDPEGRQTELFSSPLDSMHLLNSFTYPDGKVKSLIINTQTARIESLVNEENELTAYFYDENGHLDSLNINNDAWLAFSWDTANNLTEIRKHNASARKFVYDDQHNLAQELDANDDPVFTKTYNTYNQLTGVTLPGGEQNAFAYNANGALSSFTTPEGDVYQFAYDAYGNLENFTDPDGNLMQIVFDAKGLTPVSYSDFNGNVYDMEFDNNGRMLSLTLPDGSTQSFSYDCCSQNGITDENGNSTTLVRDATHRVLQKNWPEGYSTTWNYDDAGFISSFETPFGLQKNLEYNHKGQLTGIEDADGSIAYAYDQHGLLTKVTDKKGNLTEFGYNSNGKLESITDAQGNSRQLAYDEQNRLTSLTNARNQLLEISYNSNDNVSERHLDGNLIASFTYDSNAHIASMTDSLGTTTYARNARGFVTGITYPDGKTVNFDHDPNGNVISVQYPDGFTVNNTTDERNRITQIDWDEVSIGYDFDPAGMLLSESLSNGVQSTYQYNNDNTLTSITHENQDSIIVSETVEIQNGIITGIQRKVIPEITNFPEPMLNIYGNELNQIQGNGYSDWYFDYDDDRNLIGVYKNYVPLMTAEYSYDNLLLSITHGDNNTQISYNAMRYPVKITQNGIVRHLHYDHKGRLLFETNGEGALEKQYIYKAKRLVACRMASGDTYYYHFNRHGHTMAITDQNGDVVNAYAYSATGEITGKQESIENRFTFLGAFGGLRLDDNYTLTGFRVYSARQGRYLQPDPLGIVTGTNPYLYASNNPVKEIDPLGLDGQEETVNAGELDPSIDNDNNVAGGTANPYADNLPYRTNNWDILGSAASGTFEDFTNHPISDLLPDAIALPISGYKAAENIAEGEYGKALWQFVPFNNSLEAIGNYLKNFRKPITGNKYFGFGLNSFGSQQNYSCDM